MTREKYESLPLATLKELAKAISSGSLRGARGNSGVILSQLFRGFCKVIKEYDEVKTGFTYFAENDVLFAKITPCMENGKGAVAKGLHNGIQSSYEAKRGNDSYRCKGCGRQSA